MADNGVTRRDFVRTGAALAAGLAAADSALASTESAGQDAGEQQSGTATPPQMPYGTIGGVKISRLLFGGLIFSGFVHARELKYVRSLLEAYVTEEKIFETLKLAEENGINTVFECGAAFVQRYNKEYGGHMQIIPNISVELGEDEQKVEDQVKRKVDSGAPALYVFGVSADLLVKNGEVDRIAKAVECGKAQGVPVGVGGHSLEVPMACEKARVPCDFYVKTFHSDDYPSAIPKELRKEYIWMDGGPGWNNNMWCINPEETAEFMKTVTKPWIAFKVLAAGAFHPRQGFAYAFENGADFIAVGMFDFQIRKNCELVPRLVKREANRERPWRA